MENYAFELALLMHVIVASILCGIIGYERGKVNKPAGIRTNMLVGGSVALLVMLGEVIVVYFSSLSLDGVIQADPIRIIQSIVIGISFIGAGMVLHIENKKEVKYLTSSATILFSSGIGIAVALKQYILATGVTLFILFINLILAHTKLKKQEKEND